MAEDGRPLSAVNDRESTDAWASVEQEITDCIEDSRRSGRVSFVAVLLVTVAAAIVLGLAVRKFWPPPSKTATDVTHQRGA